MSLADVRLTRVVISLKRSKIETLLPKVIVYFLSISATVDDIECLLGA